MAPREILKETNETLKENKEILKDIYEFFTTSSPKLPQTYEHLNKATKTQGTLTKSARAGTRITLAMCQAPCPIAPRVEISRSGEPLTSTWRVGIY